MDFEEVMPRRSLGAGHWDQRLKRRMVNLSVADNYDDCKHEWIVTGETWYIPFGDGAEIILPDYHHDHPHECLCGHPIVWHFEIENTENGEKQVVGSEHIESYMVIRHLVEDKGYDPETITEEMIDQWVNERIKSLKAKWWWDLHGEQFTEWFAAIADLDLRVNVRRKGNYWDGDTRRYEPQYVIRKRGEGKFGQVGYRMASITWRWNNPNNSRRQIDSRGYPNERLWNDLQIFYITMQEHQQKIANEDRLREERINALAENDRANEEQTRLANEKRRIWREQRDKEQEEKKMQDAELDGAREQKRLNQAIAARINDVTLNETFSDACEYYDIPAFTPQMGHGSWEESFLTDMIQRLSSGKDLTDRQLQRLRNIVIDEPLPATDKQIWYINKLTGDDYVMPENLTRTEASLIIERLKDAA